MKNWWRSCCFPAWFGMVCEKYARLEGQIVEMFGRRFQPSMQWSCLRPDRHFLPYVSSNLCLAALNTSKITQDQSQHIFLESPNPPKKQRIKKLSTAESFIYSIGFLGKLASGAFKIWATGCFSLQTRCQKAASVFVTRLIMEIHGGTVRSGNMMWIYVNLLGDYGPEAPCLKVNLSTQHAAR